MPARYWTRDEIASRRLPDHGAPQRYTRVGWNSDDTGAIREQVRSLDLGPQQVPTLLVYPRGMSCAERVELALMLGISKP